jgi:hypothetical protein
MSPVIKCQAKPSSSVSGQLLLSSGRIKLSKMPSLLVFALQKVTVAGMPYTVVHTPPDHPYTRVAVAVYARHYLSREERRRMRVVQGNCARFYATATFLPGDRVRHITRRFRSAYGSSILTIYDNSNSLIVLDRFGALPPRILSVPTEMDSPSSGEDDHDSV